MAVFRFVFRFLALLLAFFVILPIVILLITLSQKIENREFNKTVVNTWSKIVCFVCGIKLKAKGVIQQNPVLIVANHVSWLDIPIIHSQKLLGFVAKKEIASWPLFGWIVKSGETLFIARGKHESRKQVLKLMKQRLDQGRSIAVFPEGKATNGDKLGRFHRQLLHAAVEKKIPIQAVAIKFIKKDGNRNTKIGFKKHEKFIGNVFRVLYLPSSTALLHFCEPIQTDNISARQAAILTQQQVTKKLAENDYM